MLKQLLYSLLILTCLGRAFGQDAYRPTHTIDGDVHPILEHSCDCCGKKPHYDPSPIFAAPYPWTMFTGQVAIVTQLHNNDSVPLQNQDVVIWNLTNQNPPLSTWWGTPATQYYSDPRWDYKNLGDVFGLTLDKLGNIYVSASKIYGGGAVGSLSTGTAAQKAGQIYKIANGTGTPTAFGPPLPNDGNGLGNIAWDCEHNSLFASDFYDGLIYRLDATGARQPNPWDHGTNLPGAVDAHGIPLNRPAITGNDGSSSYAALGRRPFALRVYKKRLYYSIWNQDSGRQPGVGPNEIWSAALDSTGDPTAPAQLEVVLPPIDPANRNFSNPVSDISFTQMGSMLVAERSQTGNNIPSAHQSRVLEFNFMSGLGWLSSLAVYKVGEYQLPNPTNAAGGVDSDFSNSKVVATGDALTLHPNDRIYGIQGFPAGGGDITNSFLIDADDNTAQWNKTQIGDVKVPCPDCSIPLVPPVISGPQSMSVSPSHYTVTPQAGVTYTWTVTGGTPSATSGSAIDVNWSNSGTGSVQVTATGPNGCGSVTYTLQVSGVSCTYCRRFDTGVTMPAPVSLGGGLQSLSPKIVSSMPGVNSITETLLNSSVAYSPASCGVSGPLTAYIPKASMANPSTAFDQLPVLPVANGNQAIWQASTPTAVNGVNTPFQLHLGPISVPNSECKASFSFCMSFSLGDKECRNCNVIRCFGPYPYDSKKSDTGGAVSNQDLPPSMGLMLPNMTTIEVPKDSFLAALATFLQSSGDAFEPRRFVVDHVSFEQDKAVVTQDSLPALANLAAILKAYPGSAIRLETRRDNRDRASAVQSVLEREGVPASQITVENLGPAEPKALKDTKEGEDQKRIELVVTRYVQKAEQPGTTAPSGKKKLLRALSETADIVVSNTSITNGKGTKNKDKNPQGPAIPLPK